MKVKLENLTKQFGKVTAVSELDVTFKSGKLTALLGPSGCGKSTLLFMLAGITPVTHGDIYFDEVKVTELAPEKRRHRAGLSKLCPLPSYDRTAKHLFPPGNPQCA